MTGYSTNGFIDCQMFIEGYHAATVIADGPWEAVFYFCWQFGYSPRDVLVSPKIRFPGSEYQCSVGEPAISPWMMTHENWAHKCGGVEKK